MDPFLSSNNRAEDVTLVVTSIFAQQNNSLIINDSFSFADALNKLSQ